MGLGNAGQPDGPDGRVYDRPQRRERQSDYRDGAALRGNVRREQEHGGQLQVADAARTARVPLQHYAAVEGELDEPGVQIQGPLKVHAQINYEQFPPVFIRFLARTTSAEGPSGNNMGLVNEGTIDTFLKNIKAIATADFTVNLTGN